MQTLHANDIHENNCHSPSSLYCFLLLCLSFPLYIGCWPWAHQIYHPDLYCIVMESDRHPLTRFKKKREIWIALPAFSIWWFYSTLPPSKSIGFYVQSDYVNIDQNPCVYIIQVSIGKCQWGCLLVHVAATARNCMMGCEYI